MFYDEISFFEFFDDDFILANELFAETFWRLENYLSVNSKFSLKLVSLLPRIFYDNRKGK